MYIPSRTTLAAVPPDSVAHSEDRWRYRTAGMYRSACLVARKADLRGSGWHGRHAALVVQCAVGVVLHPRRRPCAIRMRRTQLTRFPEKGVRPSLRASPRIHRGRARQGPTPCSGRHCVPCSTTPGYHSQRVESVVFLGIICLTPTVSAFPVP